LNTTIITGYNSNNLPKNATLDFMISQFDINKYILFDTTKVYTPNAFYTIDVLLDRLWTSDISY